MKRCIFEFVRRGISASFIGPIILAVLYLILDRIEGITLSAKEVAIGIISLTALAFIAGALNAIYQIEKLSLMVAILIHASFLYISYLVTYLINDWLEWGIIPLIVFSGIFIVGFFSIWAVIYLIIRKNTKKINEILNKKQQSVDLQN